VWVDEHMTISLQDQRQEQYHRLLQIMALVERAGLALERSRKRLFAEQDIDLPGWSRWL